MDENRADVLRRLQNARNDAMELPPHDGPNWHGINLVSREGEDIAYRIQSMVIDAYFTQAEQDSTGIDNTRVNYLRAGGERTGA